MAKFLGNDVTVDVLDSSVLVVANVTGDSAVVDDLSDRLQIDYILEINGVDTAMDFVTIDA